LKYPLQIIPTAEADITRAEDWYRNISSALGDRFLVSVRAALSTIQKSPKLFAVRYADIRMSMVKGFPYLIFYRFNEEYVSVLAFYHSHTDPEGWTKRMN